MTQEIEKSSSTELWFLKSMKRVPLVNRAFRREIWGIAFNAQKCRLIIDHPDTDGNDVYPCKIADVSDGGFCAVCPTAETTPDRFQIGAEVTLETWDGEHLRVEIRWISKGRLGLKRVNPIVVEPHAARSRSRR